MNPTFMKRLSSLAFAGLLCTLATGCGTDDTLVEPEPSYEGIPVEHLAPEGQVSSSAVVCPTGWHRHVATWATVGMYYSNQCSQKAYAIYGGTEVCMKSVAAFSCGGQGYSEVFQPGSAYSFSARTEAFDGH